MLSLADALVKPKHLWEGDRLKTHSGGQLLFQDHGASVLGIAHLDWVGQPAGEERRGVFADWRPWHRAKGAPQQPVFEYCKGREIVRFPSLDDRLGAWALTFLRDAGLAIDLLFTDDEERCASTAASFTPPRRYNWVFSFDRAGTDCVLYQYEEEPAWVDTVAQYLGPVECGSYSCIAELDHLEACGLNLGIGYHQHNGPHCWADLAETRAQMSKLIRFHQLYQHTHFPWDASLAWQPRWQSGSSWNAANDFDAWAECVLCGCIGFAVQIDDMMLCGDCLDECTSEPGLPDSLLAQHGNNGIR